MQEQTRILAEDSIIRGCINNDRKEQEKLYRMFADEMYNVCLVYENDRDMAKDILQDSFVKVFKNLGQFNRNGSLRAWIRRVVVNTALDHLRSKKNFGPEVDFETLADVRFEINDIGSGYRTRDIIAEVNRLPEGARLVFNLFALEGYSHKEIAQLLEITEGTSKSQYSRARQLLQQRVEL